PTRRRRRHRLSRHAARAPRGRQGARSDALEDRAQDRVGVAFQRRCRRLPPRPDPGSEAMTDLATLSARSLAEAIRGKKVSSVEATQAAIGRLKACHELTNCVISLEAEEALADARAVDAAIAKGSASGPLAGVPLAHKDMYDRKGKIASWGAKLRSHQPAAADATAIARFKSAGALQIAALHLAEFAYGPTGHNYVLGHARNPWDPTRITGGSSAGTACAVAYGAIPAGLGSDTGGSLRLPAAACGVTSIKPTWGRVSRAGGMPLA